MYTKKNDYRGFMLPTMSERMLGGQYTAGSKLANETGGSYVSDQENINNAMPYLRQAAGEMYDSQHNEERSTQELLAEMQPTYIPGFDAAMPNKTDMYSHPAAAPLLRNVQQSTSLPGMRTMQFVSDEQKMPSVSLLPNGSGMASPQTGLYRPSAQMQGQNLLMQTGSATSPTTNSLSVSGTMPGGIAYGSAAAADYQDAETPTEPYSTETPEDIPDTAVPVQENKKTFAPAKEHHWIWWVYRDESHYDVNDANDMIPVLTTLSDNIIDEIQANREKYMTKGAVNVVYNKRIEEIDKLLPQIQWYLDNIDQYIEEDGKLTKEQVEEQLSELYIKLVVSKYSMDQDAKHRYRFSSEADWYVVTFPDKAKTERKESKERIESIKDRLEILDIQYRMMKEWYCPFSDDGIWYIDRDTAMEENREENEKLKTELNTLEKRVADIEKAMSKNNTEMYRKSAYQYWQKSGRTSDVIQADIDEQEDIQKRINHLEFNLVSIKKAIKELKSYPIRTKKIKNGLASLKNQRDEMIKEIEDCNNKLSELPSYKELYAEFCWAKVFEYEQFQNDPDFAKKCKIMPPDWYNDPFEFRLHSGEGYDWYDSVNGTVAGGGGDPEIIEQSRFAGDYAPLKQMSTEEKDTYNYIHNTLGIKEANTYLMYLMNKEVPNLDADGYLGFSHDNLNYRSGVADAADDDFLDKIVSSFDAGLERFGINIRQLFSSEPIPKSATQYRYEANIESSSDLGQFVLEIVNKTGESSPTLLLGGLAGLAGSIKGKVALEIAEFAVECLSSTGEAYNFALNNHYSSIQAANYATLIGASELCFGALLKAGGEKIKNKIPQFLEKMDIVDGVYMDIAKKLGDKIITGTEEKLQEKINELLTGILIEDIDMDKDKFKIEVENYITGILSIDH